VRVLGHDDVTDHDKPILLAGALQDAQEQITALAAAKLWPAPITTRGYKV
jgi:hypothetical protein